METCLFTILLRQLPRQFIHPTLQFTNGPRELGQPARPAPHPNIQTMSPELITGFQVATLTLTLTFLLEICCSIPEVASLRTNPKGKRLYRACITANLVNNLLIGPPTYALATNFLVSRSEEYSAVRSIASALGLIVAHALGYHYAHRQMHEPSMYWAHKFHHAFAKHVTPSSANAVSVVEYVYAYMLPFVVGCAVCAPDERALLAAVAVVSVNNLLIHTPRLEVINQSIQSISDTNCSKSHL